MLTRSTGELPEHGTRARYDAPHHCHCGTCRRGNRERAAAAKARRLATREWVDAPGGGYWFAHLASKHDASTYANWGCGCPECKADHSGRLKA
jgi:hypothetical protein